MPDSVLDEFTHEIFVLEKDKVPEELRKMNQPGGGVVAWGLWTPKDVEADRGSPADTLEALIEAEADMDWRIIRELIEDMGGKCVPDDEKD